MVESYVELGRIIHGMCIYIYICMFNHTLYITIDVQYAVDNIVRTVWPMDEDPQTIDRRELGWTETVRLCL